MPEPDSFSEFLRFLVRRQRGRPARFLRYTIYIYLSSVFLFAGLYFLLFRRNPATFAFTADILSAQATTLKLQTRKDSVTVELQIDLLEALADTLARLPAAAPLEHRTGTSGDETTLRVAGHDYSVHASVRDSALAGAVESPGEIQVREVGGALAARIELPAGKLDLTPSTAGQLHEQVAKLIAFLREQLERSHDLVMRLPTVVRPNWGYVDFVYFSAITQLTVGYGDILPNTTLVRVLVIVQSLVAVLILVLVINLVAAGVHHPHTGEPPPPA